MSLLPPNSWGYCMVKKKYKCPTTIPSKRLTQLRARGVRNICSTSH